MNLALPYNEAEARLQTILRLMNDKNFGRATLRKNLAL